jgi:Cu(I)/Ag(I) efflux system membrane fusion protein/cobalt-zinc-cadmium efflux system membrane fusion protein
MHPEVVEKESGDCPICHMRLVPLSTEEQPRESTNVETKSPLLWTCPMHPEVVEREPGTCPICHMKLVKMSPQEGVGVEGEVLKIDPAIVQQIGVRTEGVRVGELRSVIRTVGILDYNEKNIVLVNTKFDGWIEKVHVNYIGEKVRKGQRLFEIYSPELVSTQEEYLTALRYLEKMKETGSGEAIEQARALKEATGKRFAYWDVTEGQIQRLETTGETQRTVTVVSPSTGVVVEKMDAALEGMYVKAGLNLYKIADLSTVWVHADIYESELHRVRPGLRAEVTVPFLPGTTFSGEVLFLQPFLTEKTRTVKACIEIENRDKRLEPGMYAEVKIKPVASGRAVLVPEDAVIRTGERDLVFLDLGEGRFLPREVELGMKGEGVYAVKRGLVGDEKVVVSAQFLLDSESRLQEFIRKLMAGSQESE